MGLRQEVEPPLGERSVTLAPQPPSRRLSWFKARFPHLPSIQEVAFRAGTAFLSLTGLASIKPSESPSLSLSSRIALAQEAFTPTPTLEVAGVQAGGVEPIQPDTTPELGGQGGDAASPDTAIASIDERRNLIKTRPDGTIEKLITVTGLDSGPRNIELNTKNPDGTPRTVALNQFYPAGRALLTQILSENGKKQVPEELDAADTVKALLNFYGATGIDIHLADSIDGLQPDRTPSFIRIRHGEYTGQNLLWGSDDIVQGDTPSSKVIRSATYFNPDLPANLNLPDGYRQRVLGNVLEAIGFGLFQAKTSQPGDPIMITEGNRPAEILDGIIEKLDLFKVSGV